MFSLVKGKTQSSWSNTGRSRPVGPPPTVRTVAGTPATSAQICTNPSSDVTQRGEATL